MAARVKSGDTENIEGQAARFYWPALLGNDFRRDPDGDWPNPALNYGYMILRAACCRAITAAGLHPVFSLQHAHRNNTFALADDIVEIFRPRVDRAVASLVKLGATQIDRDSKKVLLSLLGEPITLSNTTGPMMQQLSLIVSSLVDCIEGRRGNLDLPEQTLQGVKILPDRFYQSPGRTKKGGEPDDEPSE
jgi:CRISPR-associated protein Cas1